MAIVDIADLDVIYLSYDEPKKELFWVNIQSIVPWAKRVDGVKGSDAAHKAAADISDTDRFIIIDGDNIPDTNFFNLQLDLDELNKDCVFRWKARNIINGLQYGNGGISCWTKDFVYNMRTHENSDGNTANDVEFCFHPNYWAMHDCYSVTHPNGTPYQAWRAGFREGVKMCLDRGNKPTASEFRNRIQSRNLDHLSIWHNVGADEENGYWAMYGARLGTYMTMLDPTWNYKNVQDFDKLTEVWNKIKIVDPIEELFELGKILETQLDMPSAYFSPKQSKFFKHHYKSNFRNKGIMIRE